MACLLKVYQSIIVWVKVAPPLWGPCLAKGSSWEVCRAPLAFFFFEPLRPRAQHWWSGGLCSVAVPGARGFWFQPDGCQSCDLRPSDECRYLELCSGLRAPGFGSCSAGWPGTCRGSRLALRDPRDRGRAHAPVSRPFHRSAFPVCHLYLECQWISWNQCAHIDVDSSFLFIHGVSMESVCTCLYCKHSLASTESSWHWNRFGECPLW